MDIHLPPSIPNLNNLSITINLNSIANTHIQPNMLNLILIDINIKQHKPIKPNNNFINPNNSHLRGNTLKELNNI